jgi:hypothetical protein
MKTINSVFDSEKTTRLDSLLLESNEINDKTMISIYDTDGSFLVRGHWYEDKVLTYSKCFGKAHKAGTGRSVMFRLI